MMDQLYLGLIVTFSFLFIAIKALFPRKVNYFLVGDSRSPDPVRDDPEVEIDSFSELSDQLVIADSELNILYLSNELRSQLSTNGQNLESLDELVTDEFPRPEIDSTKTAPLKNPDHSSPTDTSDQRDVLRFSVLSDPHGENLVCGIIQNRSS